MGGKYVVIGCHCYVVESIAACWQYHSFFKIGQTSYNYIIYSRSSPYFKFYDVLMSPYNIIPS